MGLIRSNAVFEKIKIYAHVKKRKLSEACCGGGNVLLAPDVLGGGTLALILSLHLGLLVGSFLFLGSFVRTLRFVSHNCNALSETC